MTTAIDPPSGYFDLSGERAKFYESADGTYWQVMTDDRVVAVLHRDEKGWFGDSESKKRFLDPEEAARLARAGRI
ncbi:hypothetical protein GCM10010458_36630 [Microbacterium luteolum]|uniref:Uncharacterized protein n=1 Tax=Microbacterium luteolum TaxID=69367 RepID=A0ABY7XN04_MICLT|nr:hypothetical protein [Microbacterium luteolum]WDM42528.1 hypothetical protein KV395_04245 [Microbacterium luteolum]